MKRAPSPATRNPEHNVPALRERAKRSLESRIRLYGVTQVAGQAEGTVEAKARDLKRFFYREVCDHNDPDDWRLCGGQPPMRGHTRNPATRATVLPLLQQGSVFASLTMMPDRSTRHRARRGGPCGDTRWSNRLISRVACCCDLQVTIRFRGVTLAFARGGSDD